MKTVEKNDYLHFNTVRSHCQNAGKNKTTASRVPATNANKTGRAGVNTKKTNGLAVKRGGPALAGKLDMRKYRQEPAASSKEATCKTVQ